MTRPHQWHSARGGERVHHDNEACPESRDIDYYWLRHNSGGRPLCALCARLNAEDRVAALHADASTQQAAP